MDLTEPKGKIRIFENFLDQLKNPGAAKYRSEKELMRRL